METVTQLIDNSKTVLLHELFEQQVQVFPSHIAVIYKDIRLSYLQLEQRANQLAHRLIKLNINPGHKVAILVDRNDLAYLAMLAILKVGGVYVPMDCDYPEDRIHYILKDSSADLLITTSNLIQNKEVSHNLIVLDQEIQHLSNFPNKKPDLPSPSADDLCYIIYTSGSTGRPKGVELTHRGVSNYVLAAKAIYNLNNFDRVYQGFSIAFDASVEEIWVTLCSGATLIPAPERAIRAGAGLTEFLDNHRVTFLSTIPTLLSTLEPGVPSLKLLVLGGEVCPQDLIARWSRTGLRIINTYGPTEASVVTTYAECSPNFPVRIGKPLPNCEVFILNANLQPVDTNEEGELCISGFGLARGYVNRPDLNETKFITVPELGNKRLYRTGDLVRKLEDGELQFLGRLDNQIKLRGFRIEPSEIENVIMEFPNVRGAAIAVWEPTTGVQSLAAYIMSDNAQDFSIEQLKDFLRRRLPVYMLPHVIELIDQLPLLPSGKIDRKSLPAPKMESVLPKENYVAARTESEIKMAATWEKIFNRKSISIHDDFFYDLGGHSLLAAKVVSLLREHDEFQHISMSDIYHHTTIADLTEKLTTSYQETIHTVQKKCKTKTEKSNLTYYLTSCAQGIGCYLQFAILSWEYLCAALILSYVIKQYSFYSLQTFGTLIGIFLFFPLILSTIAIGTKWLLLGRIKPGNYKLWGWFYLRWWFVQHLQRILLPINQLAGSPLMNIYCRLMGAKIGKNCYLGTPSINSFDSLTIGDNSSINQHSSLLGFIVENKLLKIGSIHIGNNCFVGVRSLLNLNTRLEDGVILDDLSMVPENAVMSKYQRYHGSPAVVKSLRTDYAEKKQVDTEETATKSSFWLYGLLHYCALTIVAAVYSASFMPGISLLFYFYQKSSFWITLSMAPLASLLFVLILFTSVAVLKKILTGNIKPGTYKIKSWFYIRKWTVDHLLNLPEIEVIAESLFFPPFMRLLGAKVGKRVEMANLPSVTPELFTINNESFTASAVILAYGHVHQGYINYSHTTVGKRTFVGNTAVLPPHTHLGNNCLIGCMTIPPVNEEASKSNTAWLGSPSFYLPKREMVTGFSEKRTYSPPLYLYVVRGLIEFVRVILPTTFYFWGGIFFLMAINFLYQNYDTLGVFLLIPIVEIGIVMILAGFAISLKWLLMGRYKPDMKPLWHPFVWRRDLLEHLDMVFLARFVLEPLLGSPFVSIVLRLLGAKVGKRAFINCSRGFAEYDLIHIGDDVALNSDCLMLTHLFEDRILKMDKIIIGDNCNIGSDSEIIYNSVMENNSTLGSLSMLMKGEHLPSNSYWEGIPSQKKYL